VTGQSRRYRTYRTEALESREAAPTADRRSRRAERRRELRRRRLLALGGAAALAVAVTVGLVWGLRSPTGSPGTAAADSHGGGGGDSAAAVASPSPSPSAASSTSPSPEAGDSSTWSGPPSSKLRLEPVHTITGAISPKSVVSTQNGRVFAQNMMYNHTITVYDAETYELLETIPDTVDLAEFGFEGEASVQGAPVEAAVSADGRSMYVSQYSMYGPGYEHPGDDDLGPASGVDPSYVYRVSIPDLRVEEVIKVGSVPKFLATTPDGKYLLVSNWVSWDVSIVDVAKGRQVHVTDVGAYPRGIAIDSKSKYAYIGVMGSGSIARIRLSDFHLDWIRNVGSEPRHLCVSSDDRWLYATLNMEGAVAKVDLQTRSVVQKVRSGELSRSMVLAPDDASLCVVNYNENTVSKIRTTDMKVIQKVDTNAHPVGITYDGATRTVWVACYSGSIMVFKDA